MSSGSIPVPSSMYGTAVASEPSVMGRNSFYKKRPPRIFALYEPTYHGICILCILICPRQRLVVPHEELLIFLEDILRDAVSYGDDSAIVAIAIAVCEAGTDRLHTDDPELFALRNRDGLGFQSWDKACL